MILEQYLELYKVMNALKTNKKSAPFNVFNKNSLSLISPIAGIAPKDLISSALSDERVITTVSTPSLANLIASGFTTLPVDLKSTAHIICLLI